MNLPSSFPYKIALFIFWLIVQATLWYFSGINTGGESERFIREANLLVNGEAFTSPAFFLYIFQILLIAVTETTGAGYTTLVIFQMLVNLLALYHLYEFILKERRSQEIAFVGGILLVACIPYQLYNTFLYTESIFFSLLVIYATYLLRVRKWDLRNAFTVVLWLVALCLVRPTGLFVALATILYLTLHLQKMPWLVRLPVLLITTGTIVLIIHLVLQTGGGIDPLTPFIYEHVICDVPLSKQGTELSLNENSTGLGGLLNYIFNNPEHFLRLALKKSLAFFGLYRPWYSAFHNASIMIFFFSLYVMIAISVIRGRASHSLVFTACLTGVFLIFVLLSCDEWHNRFFLTLTPFLIISASAALGKKEGRNNNHDVVKDGG